MTKRNDKPADKQINSREWEIAVEADPGSDDCLADAASAYIAEHGDLEGWDLAPRWADGTAREYVVLTVPAWHYDKAYRSNCDHSRASLLRYVGTRENGEP